MQEPDFAEFQDRRLASLYDSVSPWGPDGEFYAHLLDPAAHPCVLDFGCGTGNLAIRLAQRGHLVTGLEPAAPMLEIARSKPSAERVSWIFGGIEKLPGRSVDAIFMTSHVAQFFRTDSSWRELLDALRGILRPQGRLIFDIRRWSDPPFPNWPTTENPQEVASSPFGPIRWWHTLLPSDDRLIRYELHYALTAEGVVLSSVNELRFRDEAEVVADLASAGFLLHQIYGDFDGTPLSPQSPEMIFIAEG